MLRVILIILFIYLLIKFLAPYIKKFLLRRVEKTFEKKINEEFQKRNPDYEPPKNDKRREGEVKVEKLYKNNKKEPSTDKLGDYVDFEEVQE